jgi:hypothetical protein
MFARDPQQFVEADEIPDVPLTQTVPLVETGPDAGKPDIHFDPADPSLVFDEAEEIPAGTAVAAACDCVASGNAAKPKQHGADPHAKNCAVYGGALVPASAAPADPVQQLEPKVITMAKLIASSKATDDDSYLVVCGQTVGINALIAEVDATFDPLVANARKAVEDAKATLEARKGDLEQVRATRAKHRDPLEQALGTNKAEIIRFTNEKERAAKEAEAKRQADEKRQLAAAAEQRAKEITTLADAGKPEQAAALAAKPLPQPVQMVASKAQAATAPKASGIVTSKVAKATVTDLAALIVGVADKLLKPEVAGPPLDLLTVGKAKLNTWATSFLKGPLHGFEGVEVTNASAAVSDMRTLVLTAAPLIKRRRAEVASGEPPTPDAALVDGLIDTIEHVPSVLNKWTAAQGTALNWPGVTVEMQTEVSASRRG